MGVDCRIETQQRDAQVWINEILPEQADETRGEAVELAGPTGLTLQDWHLVFYQSASAGARMVHDLKITSGQQHVFPDTMAGVGVLSFQLAPRTLNGLQGSGIALVNALGQVVQFLSIGGEFTAVDGVAASMHSVDLGVPADMAVSPGYSFQLQGSGTSYADFTWSVQPLLATLGTRNFGQTYGGRPDVVELSLILGRNVPTATLQTIVGQSDFSAQLQAALAAALRSLQIIPDQVQIGPVPAVGDDQTGVEIIVEIRPTPLNEPPLPTSGVLIQALVRQRSLFVEGTQLVLANIVARVYCVGAAVADSQGICRPVSSPTISPPGPPIPSTPSRVAVASGDKQKVGMIAGVTVMSAVVVLVGLAYLAMRRRNQRSQTYHRLQYLAGSDDNDDAAMVTGVAGSINLNADTEDDDDALLTYSADDSLMHNFDRHDPQQEVQDDDPQDWDETEPDDLPLL